MPYDCTLNDGGIVQVYFRGEFNGAEDITNVFQMRLNSGGPATPTTVSNSLKEWGTALANLLKLMCNVLTVYDSISWEHLNGNCASGEIPFTAPIAGTLTGDALPPQIAALSKFPTGIKRVQLRKYWGGMDSTMNSATGGSTAAFRLLQEDVNDYLFFPQTHDTLEWQYGYFSPKVGEFVEPIASSFSLNFHTQRRRSKNVGS